MSLAEIWRELNFVAKCRDYHLSLWQCPHFIFILMGLLIIASILGSYLVANYYNQEPEVVIVIVIVVTVVLLALDFIVINTFDRMAQINRLESEFISVASHQLRTPLASLKWTIGFLADNWENLSTQQRKEYLDNLKEGNDRMIQLVNNLLDVSRIDFNAMKVFFTEDISLISLVKKVITNAELSAKFNRVSLQVDLADALPAIKGDPAYLELAIQNLIDNAIKYIKDSGTVWIKLEKVGHNLFFSVRDTGVGIPKDQQNKIFQKFFRADNIMHYQVNGTGLGLFLVNAVIKAHHGKIGFTSQEGEGSTFWFTLPIKK